MHIYTPQLILAAKIKSCKQSFNELFSREKIVYHQPYLNISDSELLLNLPVIKSQTLLFVYFSLLFRPTNTYLITGLCSQKNNIGLSIDENVANSK